MATNCVNYLSNSDLSRMISGTQNLFIDKTCNLLVDTSTSLSTKLGERLSQVIHFTLNKVENRREISNSIIRNLFSCFIKAIDKPLLLNVLLQKDETKNEVMKLIKQSFTTLYKKDMSIQQFLKKLQKTIKDESSLTVLKLDEVEEEMKGGNYTMKKKRKRRKKRKNKTLRKKIKGGVGETSIIERMENYENSLAGMKEKGKRIMGSIRDSVSGNSKKKVAEDQTKDAKQPYIDEPVTTQNIVVNEPDEDEEQAIKDKRMEINKLIKEKEEKSLKKRLFGNSDKKIDKKIHDAKIQERELELDKEKTIAAKRSNLGFGLDAVTDTVKDLTRGKDIDEVKTALARGDIDAYQQLEKLGLSSERNAEMLSTASIQQKQRENQQQQDKLKESLATEAGWFDFGKTKRDKKNEMELQGLEKEGLELERKKIESAQSGNAFTDAVSGITNFVEDTLQTDSSRKRQELAAAAANTDVSIDTLTQMAKESGLPLQQQKEFLDKKKQTTPVDNIDYQGEKNSFGSQIMGAAAKGLSGLMTKETEEERKNKEAAAGIGSGPQIDPTLNKDELVRELYNDNYEKILDLFAKGLNFLENALFERILNATYVHSKKESHIILSSTNDAISDSLKVNKIIKNTSSIIFVLAMNGAYPYLKRAIKQTYDAMYEKEIEKEMSKDKGKIGKVKQIPFNPTTPEFIDDSINYFLKLSMVTFNTDLDEEDKEERKKKRKEKKKEREEKKKIDSEKLEELEEVNDEELVKNPEESTIKLQDDMKEFDETMSEWNKKRKEESEEVD